MSFEDKPGFSGAMEGTGFFAPRRAASAWQHGWRVLGSALLLCGCAPDASRTPLSSPVVPRHDVYFYGPAEVGRSNTSPPKRASLPEPREDERRGSAADADAGAGKPSGEEDAALDERASSGPDHETATKDRSGTYEGSDRVSIHFEGLPEQQQDDDRAKVRVEVVDAEKQRHAVSVLDSNSGKPLCTVEGELEKNHIDFAPDQSCFSGILGAPIDASLVSGQASFEGQTLRLELEVSLELSAPEATLDGTLEYRFEGER